MATQAILTSPGDVALCPDGSLYIADTGSNRIRRVDGPTGVISTVAGNGNAGYAGDGGPATDATLCRPQALALDVNGDLYVADTGNHRIRMISAATGRITTIAGNGQEAYAGDGGPALQASLYNPYDIALDPARNLYVLEPNINRVRKVDLTAGTIRTVAGNGTSGYSGDGGQAISASLGVPWGIAVGSDGSLYISDTDNRRIRRVDAASGIITTVVGNGDYGYSLAGNEGAHTGIGNPTSIAVAHDGGILYQDGNSIHRVSALDGVLEDVASGRSAAAIALDTAGNAYLASRADDQIYRVDATTGEVSGIAGGALGDGGLASCASLKLAFGSCVAIDDSGDLYIADTGHQRVRRVSAATQIISTVAGNGSAGYSGDGGPATRASLSGPIGLAVDASGNLYIGDSNNRRIRKVDHATGTISTIGGNGLGDDSGTIDGEERSALDVSMNPGDLATDPQGNVYLADGLRIRRIDHVTGAVSDAAGSGLWGYSGDGGPALRARFRGLYGIALDFDENLLIADSNGNYRVRRVDAATGTISTIAGNGEWNDSGDGQLATSASLKCPSDVGADGQGNVYVSDGRAYRIRRIEAASLTISTIAGDGTEGLSGDGGPADRAHIDPWSIAVSVQGDVYVAEPDNNRVRKVSGDLSVPGLEVSPSALSFPLTFVGQSAVLAVSVRNGSGSTISLSAAATGPFEVAPQTVVLAAGTSAEVKVRFTPSGAGAWREHVEFVLSDGSSRRCLVSISAQATPPPRPVMQLSVSRLVFGEVRAAGDSLEEKIEITNSGELPLLVDSLRVDSPHFRVTPASLLVPAGQHTTLSVTFAPKVLGDVSAQLTGTSDDPDRRSFAVALSGRGRPAHVTASVDTVSFGQVVVGQSSSQVLVITNNSGAAVAITNVVPGDPQYSVSSRSFTLAAGSSHDITVTYAPQEGRAAASTLTILTRDSEVPSLTLVLAATTGVSGGPATITVLPAILSFGSVAIGQSKSLTLLVSNSGGSMLRVLNLVASTGDVSVSKTSFTVAAGGEEALAVTLQPTQVGSFSEALEIPSNDPAQPVVSIPLRATVTSGSGRPSMTLDTPSLSFGQVAMGETAVFSVPVRNVGTATLTVSNVVSDNVQAVASPTSLSVPPQETRSLTVRYRPMPGGALSGRLTLYSNDTAQPQVGVSWSALEVRSPYLSLTRVTPADGAFGVATTAEIQLVFSEPLYYRRGYTALDIAVVPEPLSGPVDEDLQVRGDGRTVVIPVTLASGTVYHLVVYGATGRSGLELFDMVESSFSTGVAAPVLARLTGRVAGGTGDQVTGAVYLYDASRKLAGQAGVALDGSFEIPGVQAGTYNLYLDGAVADGRVVTGTYDINGDGVADALTVRAGVDQTGLSIMATVRTGTPPVVSNGLVAVDLDSSAGNQGLATLGGVGGGRSVVLEMYATAAEGWTGSAVTVAFDSSQVSFAGAEAGDNLLQKNGGTALFLRRADPVASTVEFGGAILGATASTAVSGSGLLGRFRFTTMDGFTGETALRVSVVKVRSLTGRTDAEPNVQAVVRSTGSGGGTAGGADSGPLALDFNPAAGDQAQRSGGGAVVGKQYIVQVFATGAPAINGWSAKVEYDPLQVKYVSGSFQPSGMVPSLVALVEEKANYVNLGGAVLGGSGSGSGNGLLGTATFEVLAGFTGSTDLVIHQMSWKRVGSGEEILTVLARGTITATAVALAGDFNGDGAVNFSDFFLFADAFGGSDPAYDLSGDGAVNFSDFFVFADAFGTGEARAKLMALAQQYLGLPTEAGLESTYPNPFNAATTIRYRLSEPGPVRLAVYGLTGQLVRVLTEERQESGSHQVIWDGRADDGEGAATGVYLVRLEGLGGVHVRKVTLLR
ncbi:MAG: choice-of-anchor D domain-containing protein [Candidatus Latescibacterota bacterium]